MEARLESELREKLISECLKWKSELKQMKKKWRRKKKRNLEIKQHNKLLNDKYVVLRRQLFENSEYQKVIAVKECQVWIGNVKDDQNNNESWKVKKLETINNQQQQANNQINSIDDKKFKCQHPGCESKFKKKYHFDRHKNIHTDKYQCQTCQKCFGSQDELHRHFPVHTGEREFVCNWVGCGKNFRQKKNLKYHVNNEHTHERLFKCFEISCGKSFKTKTLLQMHLKHHLSLRPYHCPREGCAKLFKTKSNLNQHVNYFHFDVRKFECKFENCEKAFKTRNQLTQHVNYIHSDSRKFECNFKNCQKTYKTQNDLKVHQKIHK